MVGTLRKGALLQRRKWLHITTVAMLLLAVFIPQQAEATHAMGGDITYVCTGANTYQIKLSFYRDCNGVAAPTNCDNGLRYTVRSTQCGANFTGCFNLQSVQVVTPICATAIDRCNNPAGVYGVEKYVFTSTLNLSAYSGCGTDWNILWELCCRNNAITSLIDPGNERLHLYAKLNNTLDPCNNSPTFLNDPTPFGCVGQPVAYNHGYSDQDGDSLVFALANPLGQNGVAIGYQPGYSVNQPILTAGGANAVTIDPVTGTIRFTANQQQFAVVTVRVREFRSGVLIGEYLRDVQFAIIACTNQFPSATGINGTNVFTAEVCANDQICFNVNSLDPDIAQNVTMSWNMGVPGATFTTTAASRPTGTFCWTPTPSQVGSYLFTIKVVDNACPLNGSNTYGYVIYVTPPFTPSNAGLDQSVCGTTASLTGQQPFSANPGMWSIVSGAGTFSNPNSPLTLVNNLNFGANVIDWSINYGTCGIASDQVTVTAYNPAQAPANAGFDQQICLPVNTASMNANPAVAPAQGVWSLVSGGGNIVTPNSPNTNITGLPQGTNVFRWTINNGPCAPTTTVDEVTVTVYDNSQAPSYAGPDQEICTPTNTVTMAANTAVAPSTAFWSIIQGSGTIANPNSPTTQISNLSVGENIFRWAIFNGPCTPPSTVDLVSIFVFDQNGPAANAGPDRSFCTPNTTVSLQGNAPIFPGMGLWTLVGGQGNVVTPTSPTSQVTGLGVGVNVFEYIIDNGPCPGGISNDQVILTVYDQNSPPANAGPDQFLCNPSTSATLSGNNPTYPATGMWSLVSGQGNITSSTAPNSGITGLGLGENIFRWTANNGPCPSGITQDEVSIWLYDQNSPAANAGQDQELCGPVSSTNLVGNLPTFPAQGTWTRLSGTGSITSPNNPNTNVSGLTVGENIFQWSINNGPCVNPITTDVVSIFIFDPNNPTANAGPDQDLCTPQTSTTLAGSSLIFPATGLWTVIQGSATFANAALPNSTVSGLTIGETILQWSVDNGPCPNGNTSDQVSIFLFNGGASIANAGADQDLCTPTTSTTLAGNVPSGVAVGTWSVIQGSATFANANVPTTTASSLAIGQNILQWSINNGSCGTSNDQVSIFVYDANNPVANAGADQELCTPTSTTILTGSSLTFPATGSWTLVSGSGTIVSLNTSTTGVSGLAVGENIFQWSVSNGPCPNANTSDQVSVFVFDANNPVANAGADQEICVPVAPSQVTLQGSSITFPAQGTWSIISGSGIITALNDPNSTVTGLTVGETVLQWSVDNGPCPNGITTDQVSIFVFDAANPIANAGTDQEVCTPTSSVTMAGSNVIYPASGAWTVIQGPATITDPTSPTSSVTGLGVGEVILQWTVSNGPCANPITNDQVSIFIFDQNNPNANAGPDQDICTPQTSTSLAGSNVIFPASGLWSVVQGPATFADASDPTTTVSGLVIGETILQWTVENGPCANGITSDQVSIFVFSGNASVANAGPDQDLCTPNTSSTMAGNAPTGVAVGTWSVTQGTAVFANANSPNTSVSGLSVGENILEWSIDNGSCGISSDQVSIFVFDANNPVADAGPDQELCTPNTSTTLAGSNVIFPATGAWTVAQGTGTFVNASLPNSTVNGLTVGENIFVWTVDNGPCPNGITNNAVSIFVFDQNNPNANAGPDQDLCTPSSSTTLAGSSITFPAFGQWTVLQGTAVFANASAPNTSVSGLGIGETILEWTVSNGPCANGVTSDQMSIFLFDGANPNANAGPDQEICVPVAPSQVTLEGSAVTFPAVGTWTILSGSGLVTDANDPNSTVTALTVGETIIEWSVDNGPCPNGITTDQVSIFVFDAANPNASAGPDQDLCTPQTTAILSGSNLIFPASGLWTVIQGAGTFVDATDPNTTFSGLTIGETILQWTVDNGPCANAITTDQVSIFLFNGNASVANAGPDQDLCSNNSTTTLAGNAPSGVATGLWSVQQGNAVFANASNPTTSVSGLTVGENILVWSIDNGSCGISGDQVSIFVYDENNPIANAGPDQDLCTPVTATTLAGSNLTFPASGLWTLVQGTGTFTDATLSNSTVTNLSVGENIFTWTVDNGPCPSGITSDQVSIFLFDDNAPQANAGPDQDLCSDANSTTMAATTPVGSATGMWSIAQGAAVFVNASSPTTTVTGLAVGENILEWNIDNGSCGISTDQVSIFVYDANNPNADAGPDQDLCTPITSTTLSGSNVISPAVGTWSVILGAGTLVDANDPNTSINGLAVGETQVQWIVDNGPCANGITTDVMSIFLFNGNASVADAGPDQDLCTPNTSTTLAANAPTGVAIGTWSVSQGGGTFANVNDPLTTVSGLPVGENILLWSIDNGSCGTSDDQVSIFVYDENNPDANAGPDQDLCTPTTSTTLTGSANTFPASGIWTVAQGTGVFADDTDPSTTVSGLTIGENIFIWTVDNGPCVNGITSDAVSIFLFDENNLNANAGPDQQLCTPTSSTTLAGSPVIFPALGTWSLLQGTGTFSDANDPNATISGLGVGVVICLWTVDNGPCANGITSDQMSISIFDENNADADAGPDQDQCTPNTTATMAGSSVIFPAVGTWSQFQGSGAITDVNSPTTTITALPIGENIFVWTVDNGPCANGITTDTVSIFIFDENNPNANAGPDQDLCTPVTSATMAGSSVIFPANGTWTTAQGSGVFVDANDPSTIVNGLAIGENIFVWTVDNGPCANGITSDQVSIFLFDLNAPQADAGPDQDLCSNVNFTNMAATTPVGSAIGTWSVQLGTAIFADANDPNTVASGLAIGENILDWSIDNGSCGISSDQVSIFVYDENNPNANAGPDQDLCTPTTSTTLAGSVNTFPASGLWTLFQGTGIFDDATDPLTNISGLSIGENIVVWTVDNGPCVNGITSDTVSVFLFDENNPNADAGADQELCTPTSSTTLAGSSITFPAAGTWTLVQGTGVFVDASDPNTIVNGLTVGENIFEWTVLNGPCVNATTTDQVSIFLFDENNPDANAGPDQQLCTPTLATSMAGSVNTFPAMGSWSLIQGTGAIANANDPATAITGLAVGENIFVWSVYNGPCPNGNTSDTISILVFDENNLDADAGTDQDLCTPGTSTTLSGSSVIFPAVGTWTLAQGTGVFADQNDPLTTVTGISVGENLYVWSVDNGPCANGSTVDQMSVFLFDDQAPQADAGPDQDLCSNNAMTTLTGSSSVGVAIGTWTVAQGSGTFANANLPNTDVFGLGVGENILVWSIDNGSCGISSDSMSVFVYDENNLNAYAGPDQSFCTPDSTATMAGSAIIFPAVGTWTLVSGTGGITDVNDPITGITDLTIGENVFVWTVDNGPCVNGITSDTTSIFIYDDANASSNAGPDQQLCTPDTTTMMAGSPLTFPANGQWSLAQGTGVIVNIADPNSIITGLTVGENIFVWSVFNGPCTTPGAIDSVSIFLFDQNNPNADAGPDQQNCTPDTTMVMAGSPVTFPAHGTWSLVQGTANIVDPSDPLTTVTGLTVGENQLVWMVDNGPCLNGITTDTVSLFIFDENNPVADAGVDVELCTPDTTMNMAGSSVTFPAVGTWSVLQGGSVLADANDPNTYVSGLTVGEHIFVWTVNNGPCIDPITTDTMTVLVFDMNSPDADANADQETCLPFTSAILDGNYPIFPATGSWTLISGTGTFVDATDPQTTVNNILVGTSVFVWTLDNGPCANGITTDTMEVRMYDPAAPTALGGPDINLCYPDTTTVMAGNTPLPPGYGWWTLIQGSGVFVDSTLETTAVTGLTIGVNVFTWSIYNGFCGFGGTTTTDTILINVFDPNVAPADAGPDQDLCTPVNSINLAGSSIILPATGLWTTSSVAAVFSDPADPNAIVTGLGVGQHTITWSVNNGPCPGGPTGDDMVVSIFDENAPDANAGADQSICTPQDTVSMQGNAPVFPANGWWSLLSGTGIAVDSADQNTLVTGLQVGINQFVWTIDNGPCPNGITTDTVSILVYDENQPPANAGADQNVCTPSTSTTLTANAATIPAIGTWTFAAGFGTIADVNDPNSMITGLQVGQVVLVWSIDNGPCPNALTLDTMIINVFDSNADPAMAGPDQDFCTPFNDPDMFANSAVFPAIGTWVLMSGAGILTDPNDPFTSVSGLGLGENVFEWQIDNNACGSGLSTDQMSIFVFDHMEDTAFAGPSQQFCQDINNTYLDALPTMSTGVGTWALMLGNGSVATPGDPATQVTDLEEGYNVFLWTVNNGTCGTTSDTMTVFIKDCLTLTIPDAFSPNGDDINDTYVILNIESYPQSRLQVFNRYGTKVFDRSPYLNEWDGTSDHSMTMGDKLPESTYYYILTLGDDKDTYNGFIYLRR